MSQFRDKRKKAIPEYLWMLLLSVYVSVFLNAPIFFRKTQITSEFGLSLVALDVFFAIMTCWALLCLAGLFGNKILKMLGSIIIIISATAAYYMWFFNVVIGYGIIQATFGTEISLMAESSGYKHMLFILFLGVVPAYLLFRKTIRSNQLWYNRYLWGIIFIIIAVVGIKGVDFYYKSFRHPLEDGRMPTSPFGVAAHSYLPTNWLVASAMAVANYEVNKQLGKNLTDPTEVFNFSETTNLDDLFLVFVIGESTRSDRMSLMGFDRQTTPFLQNEKNVIGYKGTSCNTITKLSLDCMFVRKGGVEESGDPVQQFVHEQNLFNVLKKMDFSLELFAMQAEVGFYNKVGSDSYKVREEIGADASQMGIATIDDLLLVEQTKSSLGRHPQGRHIVVLHTKGSHFLYTNRYPRQFAKFSPECASIDSSCNKEMLYNSYDNTILYTDYILKSLIDLLRDKKALLVYASDHGESIDDDLHFHGTPKNIAPAEQKDIPVILWASEPFLEVAELASGFEAARKKQKTGRLVHHEEIFESVLGCIGYHSSNGGIRSENNWCSPQD